MTSRRTPPRLVTNRLRAFRGSFALAIGLTCSLPVFAQLPTNLDTLAKPSGSVLSDLFARRAPQRGTAVSTVPHPAVVRVIVPDDKSAALGSGTLVARTATAGYIITNWHVVRDGKQGALIVFPEGKQAQGKIVKADPDWDLAVVEIPRPDVAPLAIDDRAPQPGERLWIAGYGSGEFLLQSGTCSQYLAPNPNWPHELVEIGASARQGDSGGPIMNARGNLAGVLFGQGDGFTTGSFGGRVLAFLEGIPVETETGRQTLGRLAHRERPDEHLSKDIALAAKTVPIDDAAGRYWQAPGSQTKTPGHAIVPLLEAAKPHIALTQAEAPQNTLNDELKVPGLVEKIASQVRPPEYDEAQALREELIALKQRQPVATTMNTAAVVASPSDELPTASIALQARPIETSPFTWNDFAGPTLVDQLKTVGWMLLGGFVFLKVCGMLTRERPRQPKLVQDSDDEDAIERDDEDEEDDDEDEEDDE